MKNNASNLTRREFVKSAAVAVAIGAVAPTILRAEDKAGAKAMVLGEGKHTYELVPGWGKLPEGKRYGNTHGVAVDKDSNVYIFNQSDDALCVFDKEGKFIKSWGAEYKPGAHGLTLNKEGSEEFLYLCDYAKPQVVKTTLDGKVVQAYPMPTSMAEVYPDPGKYKPTNLAVAPNGDVYVADGYGQSWVHQYKNNGDYMKSWGGKGKEQGQLACPHGIWIDQRGGEPVVLVADRANERLQTFALDGTPKEVIAGDFRHPCHFDTKDGDLLLPGLHGVVSILDKDNKPIARLGDNPGVQNTTNAEGKKIYPNLPHEMRKPEKFISPHGACWDHNGDLYVVEWVPDGRVTKMRRVG